GERRIAAQAIGTREMDKALGGKAVQSRGTAQRDRLFQKRGGTKRAVSLLEPRLRDVVERVAFALAAARAPVQLQRLVVQGSRLGRLSRGCVDAPELLEGIRFGETVRKFPNQRQAVADARERACRVADGEKEARAADQRASFRTTIADRAKQWNHASELGQR